jgi:hypothetical protein
VAEVAEVQVVAEIEEPKVELKKEQEEGVEGVEMEVLDNQ